MGKRKKARELAEEAKAAAEAAAAAEEFGCGPECDWCARDEEEPPAPQPIDLSAFVSEVKVDGFKFEGAKLFFENADIPFTQPKVVYISGPMQGYPDHNFAAFNEVAAALRSQGYEVVNPAENFEGRTDIPRDMCLREDLKSMAEKCNAIYLLDGWQNSAGARLEYLFARECGFAVVNADEFDPDATEPVELEASRIVRNGERQKNYGHPNADFQRTAAMWSAILGTEVTMQDMALCMAALKISRLKSTPGHHDSLVDLIGYAICYDRLGEEI